MEKHAKSYRGVSLVGKKIKIKTDWSFDGEEKGEKKFTYHADISSEPNKTRNIG